MKAEVKVNSVQKQKEPKLLAFVNAHVMSRFALMTLLNAPVNFSTETIFLQIIGLIKQEGQLWWQG